MQFRTPSPRRLITAVISPSSRDRASLLSSMLKVFGGRPTSSPFHSSRRSASDNTIGSVSSVLPSSPPSSPPVSPAPPPPPRRCFFFFPVAEAEPEPEPEPEPAAATTVAGFAELRQGLA